MTVNDFIANIEGYYRDKYNAVQLNFVKSWLTSKKSAYLPFILSEVLKAYSPSYKTCPGIKELEDAFLIVKKERYMEVYPVALPDINNKKDPEQIKKMEAMLKSLSEKLRFKNKGSEIK